MSAAHWFDSNLENNALVTMISSFISSTPRKNPLYIETHLQH